MKRYSISNIVKLPHYDQVAIFNEQVAVVSTNLFGIDTSQYLFSIDAFVIGYILDGHSVIEINNVSYDLDPGCTSTVFFFLAWATIIRMASAAAVGPSYMEALLTSIPVRVQIMLWYSNMYLSVPCDISHWYGV